MCYLYDWIAKAVLDSDLPTIALDLSEEQLAPGSHLIQLSELATDSHQAGRMGAEHLASKGFRHYAFVGIRGRIWSDRRERGFDEWIREARICAAIL